MHPPHVRAEVKALLAAGHNDCAISRCTGIARSTVRDWRWAEEAKAGLRDPRYLRKTMKASETCWRCWQPITPVYIDPAIYCELLGLYLGDGHITAMPRTQRLRLFLDSKYRGIVEEAEATMELTFPFNRVQRQIREEGAMTVLTIYSQHIGCLFPQHGPGKKHERSVHLEAWQLRMLFDAPGALLRGLIFSDGCSFVNRTGRYEYPSYEFCNLSPNILDLFCGACDLCGIRYRRYATRVRVNRRESVAIVRQHVGIKS